MITLNLVYQVPVLEPVFMTKLETSEMEVCGGSADTSLVERGKWGHNGEQARAKVNKGFRPQPSSNSQDA